MTCRILSFMSAISFLSPFKVCFFSHVHRVMQKQVSWSFSSWYQKKAHLGWCPPCLITFRVSGRGNRIGPVCVCLWCVCLCVCSLDRTISRTDKKSVFSAGPLNFHNKPLFWLCVTDYVQWGDAGGAWMLRHFHFGIQPCFYAARLIMQILLVILDAYPSFWNSSRHKLFASIICNWTDEWDA